MKGTETVKAAVASASRKVKPAAPTKHRLPLTVRRLHGKFREHEFKGLEHFDLARTYLNDGAYATGARYLRLAADELEAAQIARNDALTIMSKKPE